MRMVQWNEYPDEMILFSRGHTELPKTSSLYQLTPMLDENGVLRVEGRIGAAPHASFDARFPVILPRKHPVIKLVVDDFHRAFRHGNSETVVNKVRQYYNISRLRTVVKQVSATCQWCKRKKTYPTVPRMAPLPVARLSSFTRPFTYTGIDFFGPLLVKLFYTVVHQIYTDNGTNFKGAERLLREELESTSHGRSVGKDGIRSIKSAMEAAYNNDRKLDDEGLGTLVVEAEGIVNSRPLTYLPLDAAEGEALTPNHFLLGNSTGVRQSAVTFSDAASAVKTSWNLMQYQLDVFWKRWIREYLPMLTERMKWFGEVTPGAVGDLVLVVDDTRRNGWIRGRIKDVVASEDGRVRQAIVQTARGMLRRPVSKLAVLEVESGGKTGNGGQCYGGKDVAASTAARCNRNRTTSPLQLVNDVTKT
ncbi:uncharacterized protein LOC135714792 [Ochlerotatus camptorhynchus]|uniref:uncharacterized protein LOC135714792 n=1 Tax=Ochlerotatus camptorhynchus TaxID=644619 RepID=UPI0031DD2188